MGTSTQPLKELSIYEICKGNKLTFEVPIYQRNYAWEKDEIAALIQDVYDAWTTRKPTYFIGTLVTFNKGEQVYEVIDGQQRLTTINLVLGALNISVENKLTFRARKKSNDTIQNLNDPEKVDEKDDGITAGFKYTKTALKEIVPLADNEKFTKYFLNNVHLIHYEVPKNIDLNHYFEIMNSRGEQLEKPEIIKARLIEKLNNGDKAKFNRLWEFCSEMNVYIQQQYQDKTIFGPNYEDFYINNFDQLPTVDNNIGVKSIKELIYSEGITRLPDNEDKPDSFPPIIDFSNFLLIVLKLCLIDCTNFNPMFFNLDDKDLIKEFGEVEKEYGIDEDFVKKFGISLLWARFLLDNYLVHHSNENDTIDNNPWKLQYWQKEGNKGYLKNLSEDTELQNKMVQLLSMFEVSFTARQRKNYLFYCLLYLFDKDDIELTAYCEFLSGLAEKYFRDVYLKQDSLNEINTPLPGSFDKTILPNNKLDIEIRNREFKFNEIYGDGTNESKGIPLFIFNYIDYKLWLKYFNELRGEKTKEGSRERNEFFATLGCSDFGLKVFEQFYFSRTRRSLEHYYAQALATGTPSEQSPTSLNTPTLNPLPLNKNQINCLGNYAMIGSDANSSGSNWTPKSKLSHYLDNSGKIRQISVASLKFIIMMQKCKDNQVTRPGDEWNFEDIQEHQGKILGVII